MIMIHEGICFVIAWSIAKDKTVILSRAFRPHLTNVAKHLENNHGYNNPVSSAFNLCYYFWHTACVVLLSKIILFPNIFFWLTQGLFRCNLGLDSGLECN